MVDGLYRAQAAIGIAASSVGGRCGGCPQYLGLGGVHDGGGRLPEISSAPVLAEVLQIRRQPPPVAEDRLALQRRRSTTSAQSLVGAVKPLLNVDEVNRIVRGAL